MDMGRFLIEMHLRTGKPIKELARADEVSPIWLFKLLRRYRLEGLSTHAVMKVLVYDVLTHRSPMSRDITECPGRDSNPHALSDNGF